MHVTIFTANCIGQAANCSYPNKVTVVTPEQLREAVKADHVCAEYKGNYRGIRKNTGVQVVGLKLKEGQDFLE